MSKYVGIKFIDNFYNTREVEAYDEEKAIYLVPSIKTTGYELMSDKNIEFHLGRQEKYINAINRRKQEEEAQRIAAEEERVRFYKLNLFLDTLSPLQAGKARKHLVEKETLYAKFYSNFEFVEYMLSEGKKLQQHTYKSNNKTTWGFPNDHNAHIDISKTQYLYASFLIDKCLI